LQPTNGWERSGKIFGFGRDGIDLHISSTSIKSRWYRPAHFFDEYQITKNVSSENKKGKKFALNLAYLKNIGKKQSLNVAMASPWVVAVICRLARAVPFSFFFSKR
jgi:hypothetical protein